MRPGTIQLLSAVNVFAMVFCLLTVPGELENLYGAEAKYVAWGVFIAIGLAVAVILTYLQDREERTR